MRDKIEKILSLQGCEGYDAIGEIIALIAPELEKAEKWDKLTDDQCNKFLMLLMKDTQSPSFVCPECEYIDWSPIDYLANPLPVIRWMEKEMPEEWGDYLAETFLPVWHYQEFINKVLDLRNLCAWLIENPTWGEEICTENNRPLDCCQDRDECKLQVKIPDGKSCLGKIIHPALEYYLETKGEK